MRKKLFALVLMVFMISLLVNACSPAAETPTTSADQPEESAPAEEQEEAAPEEAAPAEEETAPEEAASEEAAPAEETSKVGGTFTIAIASDPDTLDPHLTAMAVSDLVMGFIGASLVWMSPDMTYEPYLAESWETSEDGLVWTFNLRHDVTFQNGEPLTANDYAFTFNRAIDPEVASPGAGAMLGNVVSIEAVDDYTLEITLPQANAPILYSLAGPGYMQPINQKTFEEIGAEEYGRQPVGVGPFMIKEWTTGEKIVLERNPNYNWGPASSQSQGAYNIETIEFVVIPEYATILAGLEAGEIDAYFGIQSQDVDRLEETGMFNIFTGLQQGISPYLSFNVSQPPFDDVLIRQAFNYAIDKNALIQVVLQGKGVVQHGYLSPSVMGYWPDVEEAAYDFDLEKARSLMEEAGYSLNDNGIFEKDGQPLSMVLYTLPTDVVVKTAQVLAEQFTTLGVEIEIQQMESGILYPQHFMTGDYQLGVAGLGYGEADLMYLAFHSSMVGGLNLSQLNDPEMDALLEQSRAESDTTARQEILNQLQAKIADEALVAPLFAPQLFFAVNNRWQDVVFNPALVSLDLSGAYLEQ